MSNKEQQAMATAMAAAAEPSPREVSIVRSVLEYLALDDKQAGEAVIHRAVYLAHDPHPTTEEIKAALALCMAEKLLVHVPWRFGSTWGITTRGKAWLAEVG